MSELLIDDSGEVWPAECEVIARRFGLPPRRDFRRRAVALGLVFIRLSDAGMHIALRPQLASRLAVSRLFGIIAQRSLARFAVAADARLSSWQLIIGAEHTRAQIEQLLADARSPMQRPLLLAERLPL